LSVTDPRPWNCRNDQYARATRYAYFLPEALSRKLMSVSGSLRMDSRSVARLEFDGGAEEQDVDADNLVVVAEFRDFIYPGLIATGRVERGR
jgi:hypothetical protein